ncbi:hypothetical protein M422DRAFT_43384 [Sphaerobolus stellatus SS14]|nr:hypothetical protein M422DRAFT_43384 [Sphaerobolus stellatus SS14]
MYAEMFSSSAGGTEESDDGSSTSSQGTTIIRKGRDRVNIAEIRPGSPSLRPATKNVAVNGDRSMGSSDQEHDATRYVTFTAQRAASPAPGRHARGPGLLSPKSSKSSLLPDAIHISWWSMDSRVLLENILLSGTLAYAIIRYNKIPKDNESWTFLGAFILIARFQPGLQWSRDTSDDGVLTALLLPPLTSLVMLIWSESITEEPVPVREGWLIEDPLTLSQSRNPLTATQALIHSRRNLVQMMTLSSGILLVHLFASHYRIRKRIQENEPPLPQTEGSKAMSYIGFTFILTAAALLLKAIFVHGDVNIWPDLDYFDVGVVSMFYQFTLYVSLRLARQGFTLGELGFVAQGATALFMEVINLTIAKIWPITTPFVKTFRLPTPLVIFQLAFIPGALLTGFLLSPLLVLSRHIAQRPIKRLRYPEDKRRHRRLLALSFYGLAALIIGGLIGMWTKWCMGGRDPWVWVVFWMLEGRKQWSRFAFLVYWGLLGVISVAGWSRQLARARRFRHLTNTTGLVIVPGTPMVEAQTESTTTGVLSSMQPSSSLMNGTNVNVDRIANAATELLDAADKHVPTLGRNGRRKFFHGLAVVMMVPGVAFDPAFLHLSLSAAFALFVFAEYVRYFALYPFGAVVHLFLNEFLDNKDSGTAILSHFYLLTGCAGPLWLEGGSRIVEFTGLLCLGVGDALASIVGRRLGRNRWSPSTPKTVEGSIAYTISVVFCAWLLRVCGLVPGFSVVWYTVAAGLSAMLEAVSVQNDNLTLPIYMWLDRYNIKNSMEELVWSVVGGISVTLHILLHHCRRQSPNSLLESQAGSEESMRTMDQAPDEQRRLNLPATQPVTLGDTSSSNSSSSTRYFVPQQLSQQSHSKGLSKRPSTATLGQTSDVLLPASRPKAATSSEESVTQVAAQEVRHGEFSRPNVHGASVTLGRLASDETFVPSQASSTHAMTQDGVSNDHSNGPQFHANLNDEVYDWISFIHAYAAGKWDPRLIPRPPKTSQSPGINWEEGERREDPPRLTVFTRTNTSTSVATVIPHKRVPGTSRSSSLASKMSFGTTGSAGSGSTSGTSAQSAPSSSASSLPPNAWQQLSLKARRQQAQQPTDLSQSTPLSGPLLPHLTLPPPSRSFMSRSMSDTSATFSPVVAEDLRPNGEQMFDMTAAAAAMRLAGDGIDVRPLALPSPEVELTDPFRGHTASILPWQREQEKEEDSSSFIGPLEQNGRKTRLRSFWNGLDDVGGVSPTEFFATNSKASAPLRLPTISASPMATPDEVGADDSISRRASTGPSYTSLPPASAPLVRTAKKVEGDYFGMHPPIRSGSLSRPMTDQSSVESSSSSTSVQYLPVFESSPASSRDMRPHFDRTMSAPAGMYRTSSPEPTFLEGVSDVDSTITRPHSDSYRPPRRVKEEVEFLHKGYLIPPMPPNEWERQKALYKFNIVHTAKDANFDRITLLAKLVFNAKICLISLIDSDEQWFKSEFGLGQESCLRDESLCGHAILQDSSEPLVVLDTLQDWRFVMNPMVVKHPFARFYAGAPLRTAEGFNIGSLCIIDTEPRTEFGPRQRHTLKEFAAIVMRELELWRDKIQLRIRDRIQLSMEQFTRECLEIDTQAQKGDPRQLLSSTSMEKIYDRAAKLVKRTLDVEGAVLIDVSSFEEFEMPNSELSVQLYHSDPKHGQQSKPLTPAGFALMAQFFKDFPDGKVSEAVLPACIRGLVPSNIHYALTVPILNIDKRPFAMLCAYNSNAKSKPYLEGHELSYLRAIGVIILSAVLKRRMMLADKSKSLFISNISHELRTPLHGILAAAELLSGTDLTPNQASFLSTVQACGTSLVETVNHVLDFTKLSGNTKAGGSETAIRPARVDLAQLVEEATEGCWIGHRARHASEIGSVYSPRDDEDAAAQNIRLRSNVETAVDIGHRSQCMLYKEHDLMSIQDGYVHVTLRQLPNNPNSPPTHVKIELGVLDSGKGISEDFLKNQLFQPFSQENPLQPGTGLGLAIVNSIVRSESVDGKIDVWSAENYGTEIRIIFEAELAPSKEEDLGDWDKDGFSEPPLISLLHFEDTRGQRLLKQVVTGYLENWWHFRVSSSDSELGDIVIVNEEVEVVRQLVEQGQCDRPLLLISSARGDPYVISAMDAYERAGGFARIMFKPVGPHALRTVIKLCIRLLKAGGPSQLRTSSSRGSLTSDSMSSPMGERYISRDLMVGNSMSRRRSDSADLPSNLPTRPGMPPRSMTHSHLSRESMFFTPSSATIREEAIDADNPASTIPVGPGGLLLKTSIGSLDNPKPLSVLVVEDNSILRELLVKWLRSKGYRVSEAADGQTGVDIFKEKSFDVVLLDMSMPILDGVGAATAIRRLEQEQRSLYFRTKATTPEPRTSRIIALTGMSSREDKRRAFEAGVDGYLVKPVSFKTLYSMFKQLGIT